MPSTSNILSAANELTVFNDDGEKFVLSSAQTATSTTSLAIGTGSKTFTTQSDLGWAAGIRVRAASVANSANYMEGTVTSYSSTTLVLSVDEVGGSGTIANWNLINRSIPYTWSATGGTLSVVDDVYRELNHYSFKVTPSGGALTPVVVSLSSVTVDGPTNKGSKLVFHCQAKSSQSLDMVAQLKQTDPLDIPPDARESTGQIDAFTVCRSNYYEYPDTDTDLDFDIELTFSGHNNEPFYLTQFFFVNDDHFYRNPFVRSARRFIPAIYWDKDSEQEPLRFPMFKLLDAMSWAAGDSSQLYSNFFDYELSELDPENAFDADKSWQESSLVSLDYHDTNYRQWLLQFIGAPLKKNTYPKLYKATSTTSLAIGTGSKTFTTQSGLKYVAGMRLTARSKSNPANYMEGTITSYSSTTLIVSVDTTGGSGTIANWDLVAISGYKATSTTSLAIGTGSKTFTTQSGLKYVSGMNIVVSSVANPANYMYGTITSYSGTTLVVNVSIVGGSGTIANWNLRSIGGSWFTTDADIEDYAMWQLSNKYYGYAAGSNESLLEAARLVLSGTQYANISLIGSFQLKITTLISETPTDLDSSSSSPTLLDIVMPAKPMGFTLIHEAVASITLTLGDASLGQLDDEPLG